MSAEQGYTLIELLVVIVIFGFIVSMGIPAYSNYIQEQSVIQSAQSLKSDINFQMNKSDSGINAHWYGLAFEAKNNISSSANPSQYKTFEITPRLNDESKTLVCPPTIMRINSSPCSDPQHKSTEVKTFAKGVYVDKIIRITSDGSDLDTPGFLDVRFNQPPKSGQIALASSIENRSDAVNVARVELILKNNIHERSIVIDGGNICDRGEIAEPLKCGGNTNGGPARGKVFIVNRE